MLLTAKHDGFQRQFLDGLRTMLDADELGTFILVLANSMQDRATHDGLAQHLQSAFARHQQSRAEAAEDDRSVFARLDAEDVVSMSAWEVHHRAPWLHIVNPMRGLRPARTSTEKLTSIRREFDAAKFNFNKPFLKPEILATEHVSNDAYACEVTVLYNKFPIMPYHTLLVPEASACRAQILDDTMHRFIWQLTADSTQNIPGFGVGFNSIGACASVNHLHFQGFIFDAELPVESAQWQHNGGDQPYPLSCRRFTDADACWQVIEQLHQQEQPYNLLYRQACCYLFVRKMQGADGVHARVQGAGWSELAGVFCEPDKAALDTVTAADVSAQLASLCC